MRDEIFVARPRARRVMWPLGLAVAACSALAAGPSAEQAGTKTRVRLNQIIEQFEQGRPAFAGEHWQFIEMEHTPYQIDQAIKLLADLRPEGAARPRLTPVIRIPQEGDEVFKSTIKQVLDQGVMGVIVPHVRNREQAAKIVEAMRYPPQRGAKYPSPAGIRGWGPRAQPATGG